MSTVNIAPYSRDWPHYFLQLESELLAIFDRHTINVQHIGSTSVPNLAAKPVIDIALGADSLVVIEERISRLELMGYQYKSKYEREIPMRRYFVRPEGNLPRIHLHGIVINSSLWQQHIVFRDALRSDPALAAQYQLLKTELAVRFSNDKSSYTLAKAPFIQAVINSAMPDRRRD